MKILMIEDERFIAEPTQEILQGHNFMVELAFDGETGLYEALSASYDLILLDIMLPKINGLEILKKLRAAKIKTPVIMLTARDQLEDKISGLDFGADDYLPKPFEYSELLARMRALLRRSGALHEGNILNYANLELNPSLALLITDKGSQKLTLKEVQLMELLIRRQKMTTPKELIIERLWDIESDAEGSNVEYHISRLRSKMKLVEAAAWIKSVRGLGYHLEEK